MLKELYYKTRELAALDKRIGHEIVRVNGEFAVQLERFFEKLDEEYPVEKWAVEKGVDKAKDKLGIPTVEKALEACLQKLFSVLKFGSKHVPTITSVVIDVFTSKITPNYQPAYLDDHPDEASRYMQLKNRIEKILIDLSDLSSTPIMNDLRELPKHEAIWNIRPL